MKAKNTASDTVSAQHINTFDFVSKNLWLTLIFGAGLIYMGNPAHAEQQQWSAKQSMQSRSNTGGQSMQSGGMQSGTVTRSQSTRPRNVIGSPPVPSGSNAGSQSMRSGRSSGGQTMQSKGMQGQMGGAASSHGTGDQNPGRGTKPPTDYTGTRSSEGGKTMEHERSTVEQQMKADEGGGAATGAGRGTTGGTSADMQQMNQVGAPDVNKGTTPNTNKETTPGSNPMNTSPTMQEMNKNPSSGSENLNEDTVSPGGDNMMRGTIPGGSNKRE